MKNIGSEKIFKIVEEFEIPPVILFRSVELRLLKENFKKFFKITNVLDIGCGDGIVASALFDDKIELGIDPDPSYLKEAKKRKIYKKLRKMDGRKMDLPSESFEMVFSNCVIEHIDRVNEVLSESSRVCQKNGYFMITTPSHFFKEWSVFSKFKFKLLARWYGELRNRKFDHFNAHSYEEWKEILAKHKFKVLDWYYYLAKEEIEYYDFLNMFYKFIFSPISKLNKKWAELIYLKFFKNKIYKIYLEAKKSKKQGGAIALLCQKIK